MPSYRSALATSGDLRADRRFVYAEASAAEGDHAAAADLLEQCLEMVPDWAPAWVALGSARERLGDAEAATAAYRRATRRDPDDLLGASLALARLGAAQIPAAAGPAYVRQLFDQYAPHFDAHLVDGLGYCAPALLRDAIGGLCERTGRPMRFARALDLGCGTGLAGAAFRDCVDYLEGVDLSTGMIAQARARSVYDVLHVGEVVAHLRALPDRAFHLILAADVLVYIGDLAPLLSEAARTLMQGGLFAFTTETHEGKRYAVGPDSRFAHARTYVERAAADAGFVPQLMQAASTRNNKGAGIAGLITVVQK